MFAILPYLWMLFMVTCVISVIVAAIMGNSRKPSKSKAALEAAPAVDPLEGASESLDFGDELASMEKK
jgi:hypothetical protein